MTPTFSIVVATYRRDELIRPTLQSIQRQHVEDFEALVVSDGPYGSELEQVVREFDQRFTLHALHERSRSQSGPNNLGWGLARGRHVAYLGHDDVWDPRHLSLLADAFTNHPSADFAVSGCVYLPPPGADGDLTWVTGLFDASDRDAPRTFFFPPSSFAHRRHLDVGPLVWPDPMITRRPVDSEFTLDAFERGCRFVSTGEVSVFKFASALRYLSYLCPDADEQWAMLERVSDRNGLKAFVRERLDESVKSGGHMRPKHVEIDRFQPGESTRNYEVARGITLPSPERLTSTVRLGVGKDPRGFDWHEPEANEDGEWRWSGPNHRPRLLVPYLCDDPVRAVVHVARFAADDIRESIEVVLDGRSIETEVRQVEDRYELRFDARLRNDRSSVLEFRMCRTAPASEIDPCSNDKRRLGLCLTGIDLIPLGGLDSTPTTRCEEDE